MHPRMLALTVAALCVAMTAAGTSSYQLDADLDKRAGNSLGFTGMRGKKDADLDTGDAAAASGMSSDTADLMDKRAGNTLGFSGLRGKKDADDNGDYLMAADKRARNNLGFSGMRGKKDGGDDFEDAEDAEDAAGLLDKRARNNLGFSGMRGKKDGDGDAFDYLDDVTVYGKRARSSLGFSGMRGKKDELVMEDLVQDKRGGGKNSLGFSGMRGKKAAVVEDVLDAVEAIKRARSAAFVGMRGRRENKQAFFGMRGKRGEAAEDERAIFGYLQSPEAASDRIVTFRSKRYLPSHWQLRNSKKAPFSGFIGLRGKRAFLSSGFREAAESQEMRQ